MKMTSRHIYWVRDKLRTRFGAKTNEHLISCAKSEGFLGCSQFDSARGNTFESHIRRTTPLGIFDNATLEGVFDLIGNGYMWIHSLYDLERFSYPYRLDDEREAMDDAETLRVVRGDSWYDSQAFAHAAFRHGYVPDDRYYFFGFRVVMFVPSSDS